MKAIPNTIIAIASNINKPTKIFSVTNIKIVDIETKLIELSLESAEDIQYCYKSFVRYF